MFFSDNQHQLSCEVFTLPLSTKPKRSVSFGPLLTARNNVLHDDTYNCIDEDIIHACWYTRQEMKEIRKDNRRTLEMLAAGYGFNETKYCKRGLEPHIRQEAFAKWQRRKQAHAVVLSKKEVQSQEFAAIQEDHLLAIAYKNATHRSQMEALLAGVSDAKIAMRGSALPTRSQGCRRDCQVL